MVKMNFFTKISLCITLILLLLYVIFPTQIHIGVRSLLFHDKNAADTVKNTSNYNLIYPNRPADSCVAFYIEATITDAGEYVSVLESLNNQGTLGIRSTEGRTALTPSDFVADEIKKLEFVQFSSTKKIDSPNFEAIKDVLNTSTFDKPEYKRSVLYESSFDKSSSHIQIIGIYGQLNETIYLYYFKQPELTLADDNCSKEILNRLVRIWT